MFKQIHRVLFAVCGGLLAGLALPRTGAWFTIFAAVILILTAIKGLKPIRAYWLGQLAGVFFYASQSPWMGAYLGPVPWLALAILESFIFGFGIAITALVWNFAGKAFARFGVFKHTAVAFAISCTWVFREYLAGHYPYGGYQWSRLAQTQAETFLGRWAWLGGLSLVSFVVCFLSVLTFLVVTEHKKKPGISTAASISVAVALVAIPALFPIQAHSTKSITVAGIQGNADAGLFSTAMPGANLQKQIIETQAMMADANFAKVDFVVWPENSSDIDPLSSQDAYDAIDTLVTNDLHKPLILGAPYWRKNNVYNSIFQFYPGRGVVDGYDKKRPVPFAEYVPDRPFWNALAPDLIGLIQHGYSGGKRNGIFNVAGIKAGSLICFEISIDDLVHELISRKAQLILSQANNADFGTTDETFQQESLVRLQAIETGRAVVHISTVGVSEVVLPDGTVQHRIEPFKPGYYIAKVPVFSTLTPAERFYGWADMLSVGITIALGLIALANRLTQFWRQRKQRR